MPHQLSYGHYKTNELCAAREIIKQHIVKAGSKISYYSQVDITKAAKHLAKAEPEMVQAAMLELYSY